MSADPRTIAAALEAFKPAIDGGVETKESCFYAGFIAAMKAFREGSKSLSPDAFQGVMDGLYEEGRAYRELRLNSLVGEEINRAVNWIATEVETATGAQDAAEAMVAAARRLVEIAASYMDSVLIVAPAHAPQFAPRAVITPIQVMPADEFIAAYRTEVAPYVQPGDKTQ